MVYIVQRPTDNPSNEIPNYDYPVSKLNPKAKENVFIGRKEKVLTDYNEYKNYAIAALATAAIFVVGAIFALSMSEAYLAAALTYVGLFSGIGGALYFVGNHFFNPLSKLEREREIMRFLPLERVLTRSLDDVEGLDLLKKTIEDRTLDQNEKTKTYICLRQLKRNFENLKLLKKRYEKDIEAKYLKMEENLRVWRDDALRNAYGRSYVATQIIEADVREIQKLYSESLKNWKNWKDNLMNRIKKQYRDAIDNLELKYQELINNLGTPPVRESFFSRLFGKRQS